MLSLTCKAAIKAVIYLCSKFESGERVSMKEIAEHIGANEHTVGKFLQILVKKAIVNSAKGPGGGFYLSKDQVRQPIIDIIEAIDGKNIFNECGLGLSQCSSSHPCPVHHEYKNARDIAEKLFRRKKVWDLCKPVNYGLAHLMD